MTYRLCKTLILAGKTDGMAEKLDVFLAANRLTADQYNELVQMLPA